MSTRPSLLQATKQTYAVLAVLVVAAGACSWSVMRYVSSAPILAHIDQGVQFQSQGRGPEAEREWKEAVRLDANNNQAWELLGDLYLKEHNFAAAKEAFDNVFRLAPDTPDLKARMSIAAYQLRDNDKARKLAQEELKTNPNSIAALQILVNLEKGTTSDVLLDALRRLAKLQPQNVEALNALIDELHTRDAYDQIIPEADRLVKLAPDSADSYLRRGIALYIANPTSNALVRAQNDFQKALQLDPENIEAHRYLGRLYLRQSKPRLAIAEFEAVGRGRPYASAHLMELSQAYRRAGEVQMADKTRARFTSLREINTHWLNLADQIGREPKKGEHYLQMALLLARQAFGSNSDAYHLYSFQVGRGQLLSIQEYLNKANELMPRDEKVRAIEQQVEAIYLRYIRSGEKAVQTQNYAQATFDAARALLIDPFDQRTTRLVQQVKAVGLDPSPHFAPEAVPDEHQR